jgi:hypothetical protein
MTKNIIACSLQRSGHNAIIKWLLYQNENVDEFRNWRKSVAMSEPLKGKTSHGSASHIFVVEYGPYIGTDIDFPLAYKRKHHYRNLPDSSLLIWNFVDKPVSKIIGECGPCEDIIDPIIVVMLRDWKNYVASQIKHRDKDKNNKNEGLSIGSRVKTDIFKEYADYFLDESLYYPILFDAWFSNKEYRIKICEDLGLHFTDIGKQSVSGFGGGSSFDLKEFDGKAEKMDVLNRYKLYKDNEEYKKFMKDEEAVELNNRILEKYL